MITDKSQLNEILKRADYEPSMGKKTVGLETAGGFVCFEFNNDGELENVIVTGGYNGT